MGDSLGKLFIDPHILPQNGYGLTQLIFLMVVYAYVLTRLRSGSFDMRECEHGQHWETLFLGETSPQMA